MANLELSQSVFSILSSLIEEKLGLHYSLLDRELLQEKISGRALEAGFDSLLDYYYYLRYDPVGEKEIAELADSLVVNETYFFREWPAIDVLVNSIVEPTCKEGKRPRIWSAACSTGEEPLSIAMLLDHKGLLDKVDIVASDISTRALAKPQTGRYGRRAVRSVPMPELVNTYLERTAEEEYRVSRRLVEKIQWKNLNLLDAKGVSEMGKFDVILCRNVLIYFADSTIRGVLDRFAALLDDKGFLLVGVSESLLRYGSGFKGEERGGAFVYRKGTEN